MQTSLDNIFHPLNIAVLLFAISLCANAAVYKKIDENGNVTYTDAPVSKDQKPLDVGQPMTYDAKSIAPKPPSMVEEQKTQDIAKTETEYETLTINSPENDQALRENAGNVAVSISSQPALDTGAKHQYVLYLDGKKVSESQNSSVVLPNTDRGTHTLNAEIMDQKQNSLIKSDTITFHLQRVSIRPRAR